MMHLFTIRNPITICLLFFSMQACSDGYTTSPVSDDVIHSLNDSIAVAQQNGAVWTKMPDAITGHFYPRASGEAGNMRYQIIKQDLSPEKCITIVIDEGLFDDEVLGERRTLNFQLMEGRWKITGLQKEIKRRD